MRSLLSLSIVFLCSLAASGQQYDLVEATGIASGSIELGAGRLVVYQSDGQRHFFSRQASYDSPDGRFVGYFSSQFNRVLRFPRTGSGYLQTADLDDLSPRFRNTRYMVRPAAAAAGPARPTRPTLGIGWGPGGDLPRYNPGYVPPVVAGYRGGSYFGGYSYWLPQSVLIDSQTIPNPPLPAARVVFRNDGPRELEVGVVDLIDPVATRSIRIRPAASVELELQRDAGARRIAHYRVITPLGESITNEIVTDVPAEPRYEIVVHEWAVQSVAIDRTGKSPNQIEEINFQGRGIGSFPLPAGSSLQSGTIDVYRAAKSSGNAGSIAPLIPNDDQGRDSASALDRAILEAQQGAQGLRP